MFSELIENTHIDNFSVRVLPKRYGIWRIKKPFKVVARLLKGRQLTGYILYNRRNNHCFIVDRGTFARAVLTRQVKNMKYTSDGVESRGDLRIESLPYYQVTDKNTLSVELNCKGQEKEQ